MTARRSQGASLNGAPQPQRLWIEIAEKAERPEAVAGSAKDTKIAALHEQVRELEMEGEILRRAAKCFAGEKNW